MGKGLRRFATLGILMALVGLLVPITASPAGAVFRANVKCGELITESTTLGNDISCPTLASFRGRAAAITLGSDNITFNLNGHKIQGLTSGPNGAGTIGIDTDGTAQTFVTGGGYNNGAAPCSLTATRGRIIGFDTGIRVNSLIGGLNGLGYVSDINRICVLGNVFGISLEGLVPLARVHDNWVWSNGDHGIQISPAAVLDLSLAPRVENNDVRGNGFDSELPSGGSGIQIFTPTVSIVNGNVVCGNAGPGIRATANLAPIAPPLPAPIANLITNNIAGRNYDLQKIVCATNDPPFGTRTAHGLDLLDESTTLLAPLLMSGLPCGANLWAGNKFGVIPNPFPAGTPRAEPGCTRTLNSNLS